MVYVAIGLLGLCLGSFVNALVWRIRQQEIETAAKPKGLGKRLKKLSVVKGRSMCVHCEHELAAKDLIPVVSWLMLKGKCRYCGKKIDDSPFTELVLPVLFIISYIVWPYAIEGWTTGAIVVFILWLGILTCFLALAVYDAKWQLLPDRIVLPTTILALALVTAQAVSYNDPAILVNAVLGGAVIAGLFYGIWYISKEQWIGGGDVKLAPALGLLAGSPFLAFFVIFFAAVLGTIAALPFLITKKYNSNTLMPFGPFLIAAAFIVFLWGGSILNWYLTPY